MSKSLKLIGGADAAAPAEIKPARKGSVEERMYHAVSYTHLTLPTM